MDQGEIAPATVHEHERIAQGILIPRLRTQMVDRITTREIAVAYHRMVVVRLSGRVEVVTTAPGASRIAAQMGLAERNLVREVAAHDDRR